MNSGGGCTLWGCARRFFSAGCKRTIIAPTSKTTPCNNANTTFTYKTTPCNNTNTTFTC